MSKFRSDTAIWQEVKSGKTSAWDELILKYQKLVYAVVSRSGLSYHDASDCFQQVWVILYNNRKKITQPEKLSSWLVTTSKREVLKLLKQNQNKSDLSEIESKADTSLLPDEELESLELQNELESHISNLDKRCQTLIKAIFFSSKHYSYDDLADMLSISTNALGPAKRRCLNRLRKLIEESGTIDARIFE